MKGKNSLSCFDDDDTKKNQLVSWKNVDVKSKENKGDGDEGTTAFIALREANILEDGKSYDDQYDVDPTIATSTGSSNFDNTGEASIPLPVAAGLNRQEIYRGPQTPGAYVVRAPALHSTSTDSTVASSDELEGESPTPPMMTNLESTVTSAYYAVHAEVVVPQCPTAQVRPVDPKTSDDIEAQKLRESSILVVNAKPIQNKNSTKGGEEVESGANKSSKSKKQRKDIVCIQKQYLFAYFVIVIISVTLTVLVTTGVFEQDRPPQFFNNSQLAFNCENPPPFDDSLGYKAPQTSNNNTTSISTTQHGDDRLLRKGCHGRDDGHRGKDDGGGGDDDDDFPRNNSSSNNSTSN